MAHKFEIFKNRQGEFAVRFKVNNETLFFTEGYSSKNTAKNAIESMKKNGPEAPLEDLTEWRKKTVKNKVTVADLEKARKVEAEAEIALDLLDLERAEINRKIAEGQKKFHDAMRRRIEVEVKLNAAQGGG